MLGLHALLLSSLAALSPDAGTLDAGASGTRVDAGLTPAPRAFDVRWSRVTAPAKGLPLALGLPGAGCVQGGVALPLQGVGWIVARPERHREFGHPSLIAFLRKLAASARKEQLGLLVVGDLGQPRGGPTPTGHRSHQSGLDVDLWYEPPAKAGSLGKTPAPPSPSVVDLRTGKMLSAWNARAARLVEVAASQPAVDRIFVHPAVKRALCQDKARRGPWLARVRPWWGHQDHFHVRLACPKDSPDCTLPQPLPAGEGCDASLNWWFSEDSRKTAAKRSPPGENAPAMPEQCEEVLRE
jgi:penicillin-insensitive murein endopeptidase